MVKEALNVIYLQENGSLFNHTLIVAEPNSEFKYIENYCNTVSGNINVISETVVKENAQVDYAAMDRLTSETLVYNLRKARVEANGRLLVSLGALMMEIQFQKT